MSIPKEELSRAESGQPEILTLAELQELQAREAEVLNSREMRANPSEALSFMERQARQPKVLTAAEIEEERVVNGRLLAGSAGVFTGMFLHLSATCINPLLLTLPFIAGYVGGEAGRQLPRIKDCIRSTFFAANSSVDSVVEAPRVYPKKAM